MNNEHKNNAKPALRIIPLGGIGEIGKNMTVIEYGDDMIVIDCGLCFPREDMLGIDYIIPDITYVQENISKLRGILITHGHEDHIGGLPYVLPKLAGVPVYGTEFSLLLIDTKKLEHDFACDAHIIKSGDRFKLGCFDIEPVLVNHSITGAVGYAITTPIGTIVHTGDFKIDYTPQDGHMIDLARFSKLGTGGVLALLSDSTNSDTPGYTMSESLVADTFAKCFKRAQGRIILATFSSNINRIQQVADASVHYGRKVAVSGRSMEKIVSLSREHGYLSLPDDALIDIGDIGKYPEDKLVILTTGSQGESMSGLTRMASGEHKQVTIHKGDMIILSASAIPGNERYIADVINMLYRSGAQVVNADMEDVHVSGHACQEEQKLLLSLVRPKYFIPVHGEYRHLYRHEATARGMGVPEGNTVIPDIGAVIEITRRSMRMVDTVESGNVLIDGLGVGDIGAVVLRDRKVMSQDGLLIAIMMVNKNNGKLMSEPEIISRGFVYVKESESLMEEVKTTIIEEMRGSKGVDRNELKKHIKKVLREQLYEETQRNPMILPVIFEV